MSDGGRLAGNIAAVASVALWSSAFPIYVMLMALALGERPRATQVVGAALVVLRR